MAERIVFGSDHAGLALRAEAVRVAREAGFEIEDLGPFTADSVDYPDFAARVGERVIGLGLGGAVVKAFLEQAFEGGRHQRRVDKISALDR